MGLGSQPLPQYKLCVDTRYRELLRFVLDFSIRNNEMRKEVLRGGMLLLFNCRVALLMGSAGTSPCGVSADARTTRV